MPIRAIGDVAHFNLVEFGVDSVLHVVGEVDIFNSRALADAIRKSAAAHAGQLTVSFVNCAFADCSSLGVLVHASKELPSRLRIIAPPGTPVRRLLDLTALTENLPVRDALC